MENIIAKKVGSTKGLMFSEEFMALLLIMQATVHVFFILNFNPFVIALGAAINISHCDK